MASLSPSSAEGAEPAAGPGTESGGDLSGTVLSGEWAAGAGGIISARFDKSKQFLLVGCIAMYKIWSVKLFGRRQVYRRKAWIWHGARSQNIGWKFVFSFGYRMGVRMYW